MRQAMMQKMMMMLVMLGAGILLVVSGARTAAAQTYPLDPNEFVSLGASPFDAAGTYTIDASKDNVAPTLTKPDGTIIYGVFYSPSMGATARDEIAVFTFDSIAIAAGVVVRGAQSANSRPVALLSRAGVTIDGTIDVSGANGANGTTGVIYAPFDGPPREVTPGNGGAGGNAGPGGGGGGGEYSIDTGDRPGRGGVGFVNGDDGVQGGFGGSVEPGGGGQMGVGLSGSGGAFGGNGASSGSGGRGGTAYGDLSLKLQGGSGGGGGATKNVSPNCDSETGDCYADKIGGGGGGGGGIEIGAAGSVSIGGSVLANGGAGGGSSSAFRGGGGAGGGIFIHAQTVALSGALNAAGGNGSGGFGGGGGGGRVLIRTATGALAGGSLDTNVNVSGGGGGGSGVKQLSQPANTAPVAAGDAYATDEDTALSVAAPGVLANDTDAQNNALTATLVSAPANAAAFALNADGSFSYTPNANFNGADSFTSKAGDGALESNTATVQITVSSVNDSPDAADDAATVGEDSGATIINVLANDADPDSTTLTVSSVTNGANGTVAITNGGANVSYTPNANYNGADSFTYTISDSNGGSDTATVQINVTPVNDAPTINAAAPLSRQQGATGAASTIATVADIDHAAGGLSVSVVSAPTGITVTGITNTGGTITANVAAACNATIGANTVGLRVSDGVATATANLTVNVTPSNASVLTLKPSVSFWPPNHSYRTVTISQMVQSATDDCDGNVAGSVVIEKVTSDEPDDVAGDNDGITTNDIVIAADCKSVQLRAERDKTKNGRVYVVTLRVRDSSGNTTRAEYRVSVPIDQSGAPAIDSGANYTVTSSCQ